MQKILGSQRCQQLSENQSVVSNNSAVGGPGPPMIFDRWREKGYNRWDPHLYELVCKIGCICSDFRNENFENFHGFSPHRFRSAKSGPHKTFCPATVLNKLYYEVLLPCSFSSNCKICAANVCCCYMCDFDFNRNGNILIWQSCQTSCKYF